MWRQWWHQAATCGGGEPHPVRLRSPAPHLFGQPPQQCGPISTSHDSSMKAGTEHDARANYPQSAQLTRGPQVTACLTAVSQGNVHLRCTLRTTPARPDGQHGEWLCACCRTGDVRRHHHRRVGAISKAFRSACGKASRRTLTIDITSGVRGTCANTKPCFVECTWASLTFCSVVL